MIKRIPGGIPEERRCILKDSALFFDGKSIVFSRDA